MANLVRAMPSFQGASPSIFLGQDSLADLPDENQQFLNVLHTKNGGRTKYDRVLVLSLDAEWFQFGARNVPLSYQIAAVSPEHASNVGYYTRVGARIKKRLSVEGHLSSGRDAVDERFTLEEIVEQALRQHDGGQLANRKSGTTRVILVAHNSVAEWSMLADRDEDEIVKRLTVIRKSPVTGVHPIKLRNRRIGKVDLEIFDTRLLAPAGLQSLAKLSELLGKDWQKFDDVSEYEKRNMHVLLHEDSARFEKYALRDTAATAKIFFLQQRLLNDLAFGYIDRPFKTLASAAVRGFLNRNQWFEVYREALSEGKFGEVIPIITRAYLGGLNMGCFRGDTESFELSKNYIFVDIDFANAYANAMARCAKIDLAGEVDIIQAEYLWNGVAEKIFQDENLPPDLIERAKSAVADGRDAFEALLRELNTVPKSKVKGRSRRWRVLRKRLLSRKTRRNRIHAKILRDALSVPNNRHLNRWIEQSERQGAEYEIPGFASVRFKFPAGRQFPCLPEKCKSYGLAYTLEGSTLVPATELVLAVKAGAEVEVLWSVELPIEKDINGKAKTYFYSHLKELVAQRAKAKAKAEAESCSESAALEAFLKEAINAFYGKTAQGLNYRTVFNPSTGEFFPLVPSELTESSVAALVTAQVRAALASTLLAIEGYNASRPAERPIIVISATTDGLLIGIPCESEYSVTQDYFKIPSEEDLRNGVPPKMKKGIELSAFLARFGHAGLLDAFYSYAPIQNLRLMRQKLTGKDDFLEIKHLCDRVVSVKTRGQIGMVNYAGREYCSLIARYGHKIPLSLIYDDPEVYSTIMEHDRSTADAQWLFERIEKAVGESEIEKYPFGTLESFKGILESEGDFDLVSKVTLRRANSDWDFKRRFAKDEQGHLLPMSSPHKNVAELLRYRRQADSIRKGGQNATPELVEQRLKVKGRGVRARSGHAAMLVRTFLRGFVQGHFGVGVELSEVEIAGQVNGIWQELVVSPAKTWSRTDINNAKRGLWEANVLIHNPDHDRLLQRLCEAFDIDPCVVSEQMFANELAEKSRASLARVVVQAIMNGPRLGIDPFVTLHRKGLLPGKSVLMDRFHYYLHEGPPIASGFPTVIPAEDRAMLKRLFALSGLSSKEAQRCAEVLSPIDESARKPRRNPSHKKCMELFITALQQPDISVYGVGSSFVLKRLKPFGLSKRLYYGARSKPLVAKSLKSTSENKRQIEQMAEALELDAGKFLKALLEVA